MADLNAGVSKEQHPFLVELAATGGPGVSLRHSGYPGGAAAGGSHAYRNQLVDS